MPMRKKNKSPFYRKMHKGFPVGENIDNCYLKGFFYIPKETSGKDWYAFQFNFKRGTSTLYQRYYFKDKDRYKSPESYWKSQTINKTQIERILSTFFSRDEMREINIGCINKNIYEYFMLSYKLYKEKGVKDTPVILKVVKDREGYIELPSFGEFIRPDKEGGEDFSFSDFEKKIVKKYDLTSVYGEQNVEDIF